LLVLKVILLVGLGLKATLENNGDHV